MLNQDKQMKHGATNDIFSAARPTPTPFRGNVELSNFPNDQGFMIQGVTKSETGESISGVGDVNEDGIADFLIGAPNINNGSGAAYLVYGGQNGTIDLASFPSTQGFVMQGPPGYSYAGLGVSGTGDVNGDGIPDLLIGASGVHNARGAAYVVYGGQSGTIDLASFPSSQGFVIQGDSAYSYAGSSVSGTGDVNGDGIPDLLIGADGGNSGVGAAYLVYGGQSGTIDLSSLPSDQGFVMKGVIGDYAGASVSGTGDVNGDGIPDLLIGASSAFSNLGGAYLVYGGQSGTIYFEDFPNSQGFVIQGPRIYSDAGTSVSGTGDVNGDGVPDLLIGAWYYNSAYLVYGGQNGTIDLATFPSTQGFVMKGPPSTYESTSYVGWSVSGTGDVNGDSIPDLLVGDYGANSYRGAAYVIYGGQNGTIHVGDFPSEQGFAIMGARGDLAGSSVSGAGDMNGDGVPDLLVGASGANTFAGTGYVIYGQSSADEQDQALNISSVVGKQFEHFYQQGKQYLASFLKADEKASEPELLHDEQVRLKQLAKMQTTLARLSRVLNADTRDDKKSLQKAVHFYQEKINDWQKIIGEPGAQDFRDLQTDIAKLQSVVYGIKDFDSVPALTQSTAGLGFFKPVNVTANVASAMIAAQANRLMP